MTADRTAGSAAVCKVVHVQIKATEPVKVIKISFRSFTAGLQGEMECLQGDFEAYKARNKISSKTALDCLV